MPAKKYKNPPILEALCELTFAPAPGAPSHLLTLPGLLQSVLGVEYAGEPREQRVQTVMVPTGAGQGNVSLQDQLFRIQLPTKDNTRLLAIGPNVISVSMLRPYGEQGWNEFLPRIERALEAYRKIANPIGATRVGIRYINQVDVPEAAAPASKYFTVQDQTQNVVGGRLTSFLHRAEHATEDGVKILVTHATINPVPPHGSSFLLDIDVVWDASLVPTPEIIEKVKELHEREGKAFEALITDDARRLFDV